VVSPLHVCNEFGHWFSRIAGKRPKSAVGAGHGSFVTTAVIFPILCVLAVAGLAFHVMEPAERARARDAVIAWLKQAFLIAGRLRATREPLEDVLRSRTRFAVVTPGLIVLNAALFLAVLLEPGASSEPATLVRWGASFGPATTNGEWWRLVTSTVVHASALHLAVNLAALCSMGLVLERLVGHFTFAAVYVAAALFAGVAGLTTSTVAVHAGGGPAIFGLYGLLLGTWLWGAVQHATTTIRLRSVMRLAPPAALFALYQSIAGEAVSNYVGLVTGLACGLALSRCVQVHTPSPRRTFATMMITGAIAVVAAVPLRGMIDIRPEVQQLFVLEERLAGRYQAAVDEFTKGRVPRRALIELIERGILPELELPRSRLKGFTRTPPEHRPMLLAADQYLRLREEGWRLRATALRHGNMSKLRQADDLEHASLAALRTITRTQ
jgi:rhomboid protease GluP